MPALPGGLSARHRIKAATPIVAPLREDVWERTLDQLGLEPLNVKDRPIPSIPANADTSNQGSSSGSTKDGKQFHDLPNELQKKIFGFVSSLLFCAAMLLCYDPLDFCLRSNAN